jgi:hypothetical protein
LKKIILLFGLILSHVAVSQPLDLSNYSKNTYSITFQKNNKHTADFWNEAPPWVVKGGWYQYFLSTHFSAMWSTPVSLATPRNQHFVVGSKADHGPTWIVSSSHWWGKFYRPDHLDSEAHIYQQNWNNDHWRRNYNGVFSAHLIEQLAGQQPVLFAISHGENKNEKIGANLYQNSVRTSFKADANNPSTYSGGSPYQDCWEAYFGFLNGNWIEYTKKTDWGNQYLHDLGPIAWPAAGYIKADGSQASNGLRHPSSLVHDGYVYIYVLDASHDGTAGIKLIRSKLETVKTPELYEAWTAEGWAPSLPKGFRKENSALFFSTRGPESSPVFTPDRNTIRFSVAKLRGSANRFIGVEEYLESSGQIFLALRYSDDLITWSDRTVIYTAKNWHASKIKYPIFLNKDGSTNTEIDAEDFYILGTMEGGGVTKMHMKLKPALAEQKHIMSNIQPQDIHLHITPNPTAEGVLLRYTLPEKADFKVSIHDMTGKLLKTPVLADMIDSPQVYEQYIDISDLSPGIYIFQVYINKQRISKKVVKH